MPELDLRIPQPFKRALEVVETLDDATFRRLVEALEGQDLTATEDEVCSTVADAVVGLDRKDVTRVIAFAVPTRRLVGTLSAPVSAVAAAIATAYKGAGDEEPSEILRSRIAELLDLNFIALKEKSVRLANDATSLLKGATSYSDMRPVFAAKGDPKELIGFMVLNTLKLEIEKDGESQTSFVQLDLNTLIALRAALDRATMKSAELSKLIERLQLVDFTVTEEPGDS